MSFATLLEEHAIDLEKIRPLYESLHDVVPFEGEQRVTTGLSAIDGIGIFALETIRSGEFIAIARQGLKRTPAGRYANHSDAPNSVLTLSGDDFCLIACREIAANAEIVVDYRPAFELIHTRGE